ncbi:branched-chain amino acid ABC transporter permease [Oceanithermus sp.]|uniref:branched-chain amino acid ABC transporter permease n=2 Tax=Oceanithermus sp. TaxID=2268145 RepID=UPI00257F1021|nr:branched-chain amino acid ABC transporter permease [Oceanithermus sp.]
MKTLRSPFFWLILALTAFFAFYPKLGDNVTLRETLVLSAIYIILAANLNLMIGYTGYVNFGSIVFFGLGGYLTLWLVADHGWNVYLAVLLAGAMTSLLTLALGFGILRLRGAYFALATIGVNEAVKDFVSNYDPWGGSEGIFLPFSTYKAMGGAAHALWTVYFLIVAVMGLSLLVSWYVKRSKFGLGLFAIREDEDAAIVLGVKAPVYKAFAYSLSAFLPAVAGGLYFFKNGSVVPEEAFNLHLSIESIVMVMLGGQGTVTGPAVGAFLYERLRGLLLTTPSLSNFHLVIAGVLLLLIILFAPGGLMGWLYKRWPRVRGVLE